MIFSVSIQYNTGDIPSLEMVSVSLQKCIDHMNSHKCFPSIGRNIIFSVWGDNKTAEAIVSGYRGMDLTTLGEDKKFTYEEVMEKLCCS